MRHRCSPKWTPFYFFLARYMDVLNELKRYLEVLPDVFNQLHQNRESYNVDAIQEMQRVADREVATLFWFIIIVELEDHGLNINHSQKEQVCDLLCDILEIYQELSIHYSHKVMGKNNHFKAETLKTADGRGRTKFQLDQNHLLNLKELGFSWVKIAEILGVSRSTISRRCREFDISSSVGVAAYSEISDDELDAFISSIVAISPNSGEVMIRGALQARGVKVQRRRLRDSLWRVDPTGREMRRRFTIQRRKYQVTSPNALWHIDGNHKMIRWRFVIHGGIDGFSRTITYLKCSTNNTAETVLGLFEGATDKYGCPERVRSDFGTENVGVAKLMLHIRKESSHPFITGRSVHNQRIERLWRDVNVCINAYYKDIFYHLESVENVLDILNEVHILALHYVYLPRINRSIQEFVQQWNNHPLTTEHSLTPLQLWVEGIHRNVNSNYMGVREIVDGHTYGIDFDGPLPTVSTANNVEIPESPIHLNEDEESILQMVVNPLDNDGNH